MQSPDFLRLLMFGLKLSHLCMLDGGITVLSMGWYLIIGDSSLNLMLQTLKLLRSALLFLN